MVEITALFELLNKGGPYAIAMVFAFMWWLERTERKAAQEKLNATLDSMKGTNAVWLDIFGVKKSNSRRD